MYIGRLLWKNTWMTMKAIKGLQQLTVSVYSVVANIIADIVVNVTPVRIAVVNTAKIFK